MPINSPSVCAVNIRLNIPYMPASSTSTPHISGSTHTLEPDFLTLNDVAIEGDSVYNKPYRKNRKD